MFTQQPTGPAHNPNRVSFLFNFITILSFCFCWFEIALFICFVVLLLILVGRRSSFASF